MFILEQLQVSGPARQAGPTEREPMSATKESIETLARSIRSAPWPWTRCRRRTRAILAPMGLAPTGYVRGSNFYMIRPIPPGPTAIASCFPMGPCVDAALLAADLAEVKDLDANGQPTGKLAVTLDNIKRFRQLDSPRGPSGVSSLHGRGRPPVLWAKAWPTASAWPSRVAGWRRTITGRI